jgi:hypothetical protein
MATNDERAYLRDLRKRAEEIREEIRQRTPEQAAAQLYRTDPDLVETIIETNN